jgi:hypothetical protein
MTDLYDIAEEVAAKRGRTVEFRYWPDHLSRRGFRTPSQPGPWRLVELDADGNHSTGCCFAIAETKDDALASYVAGFVRDVAAPTP